MRVTKKHILLLASALFVYKVGNKSLSHAAGIFTFPLVSLTHKMLSPLIKLFTRAPSYTQLKQAHTALVRDHERLLWQYVTDAATHHYARRTHALRAYNKKYFPHEHLLAQVTNSNFDTTSHTLLVNKGSSHGVTQDMLALYKRQLVGTVRDVHPYYCIITCITDPSSKIAAVTARTHSNGIVCGSGENHCTLEYVDHLAPIDDEELVLSSGKGGIVSHGYGLGKITSHHSQGLKHRIELAPLINIPTLEYCLLVSSNSATSQ